MSLILDEMLTTKRIRSEELKKLSVAYIKNEIKKSVNDNPFVDRYVIKYNEPFTKFVRDDMIKYFTNEGFSVKVEHPEYEEIGILIQFPTK